VFARGICAEGSEERTLILTAFKVWLLISSLYLRHVPEHIQFYWLAIAIGRSNHLRDVPTEVDTMRRILTAFKVWLLISSLHLHLPSEHVEFHWLPSDKTSPWKKVTA